MSLKLELTKSPHGMHCLSIRNPSEDLRWYLKFALGASRIDDPFYINRQSARPFLQCDQKDYVLVEFWTDKKDEILKYLRFLEAHYDRTVLRYRQLIG